jgi:hypothetical protein
MATVGALAVTGAVGFSGLTAGGATAPTGLNHGSSVRAHPDNATGTYDIVAGGTDFGLLDLNANLTFSIASVGDSGVWVTTGSAISMSITSSSGSDLDCTFSGLVNKKGINGATAKKQGNYTCPDFDGGIGKWYAVKTRP